MNKYIVMLSDKKRSVFTRALLIRHIEHLRELSETKRLFLCGPFKDNDGALQILIADSKENAEKMINDDPFISENYYQSYTIQELIEANEENNFLFVDKEVK